jgi:hypothetical protein
MRAIREQRVARGLSFLLAVVLSTLAPIQAFAHRASSDGPIVGVAIPAIAHGEMSVVARYRKQVLDLAARQAVTDPTFRKLSGFVSLQYFACFWGLVPGSVSDENSPFNECSHGYLAGVLSLLAHMTSMPGNQMPARELEARLNAEIASDPTHGTLCSNSSETFDSAVVIGPDWQLAPAHWPTVLTFVAALAAIGLLFVGGRRLLRLV